jgi:type III secretion translocon protein HrpF
MGVSNVSNAGGAKPTASRPEANVDRNSSEDSAIKDEVTKLVSSAATEGAGQPAQVDQKMEILSVLSRNQDKLPDSLEYGQLDELAQDKSLPQELRDAYTALKNDKKLFAMLDDPNAHVGGSAEPGAADGFVSKGDLDKELDQKDFTEYSRMKSDLFMENYVPSDAAPGEGPRQMTASDAYRELYIYSDSLPDGVDQAALQAIVDGKCDEKCPAQLQAAAQYFLKHPEEFAEMAPQGSVTNGELQNIAVDRLQFTEQELSAVETLGQNKDLFIAQGDLSRERLAEMAKDKSLAPEIREAAKTLGESDVLFGMLDNAKNGHVASDGRGLRGRGANVTNDNKVIGDDINAFLDGLTETNKTARPTGGAGADSSHLTDEMQAMLSQNMMAGMLDDPNAKEKRGGGRLERFLDRLGGALDKIKQGLDYLSAIPGIGVIFAGASTVVSAIDKFAVEAPQAMLEGKSRAEAFKEAAKDFGKESAMNALAVVPGGGAARAGAAIVKTTVRETAEGAFRTGMDTMTSQVDNIGATLATKATDKFTGAAQGKLDDVGSTLTAKTTDSLDTAAQSKIDDAFGTAQGYGDDAADTARGQMDDKATSAVGGHVDELGEGVALSSSDDVGKAAGRESTEAAGKNSAKSTDDAKQPKDADNKKSKDRDDDKMKKEKQEREQQHEEQAAVSQGSLFVPVMMPLMPLEQLKDKKKRKEEPVSDNLDAAHNR